MAQAIESQLSVYRYVSLSMYPPCILIIPVMEQKLTETNFARCSFNYMNLLTVPFTINIYELYFASYRQQTILKS